MKSEKETDFFGNEKTVHYDDYGRKIGESQEETDFFGNKKVVHYDSYGHKTGESQEETDFFGNEKTVHYDDYGHKTGESQFEKNFFGDEKVVHYDDYGHKTGESYLEKDFFGNEKVVTYGASGGKVGEYRDNTPRYGGSSGSSGQNGGYSSGSAGGYSGSYYNGDPLTQLLLGIAAVALAILPFIMYFATKHSADAVGLIRTAAIGLCPIMTLVCLIAFRAKRGESAAARRDKRRMIISTALLFLVQELCFLFYTDPAGEGDSLGSFILFVAFWIPKLIYSIVTGIFTFKSEEATEACKDCYRFSSIAFAVISGAMELTNIITEGDFGDIISVIILFIPAMAILWGMVFALTAVTDWIYKKIAC